jgi:hypothetical protein
MAARLPGVYVTVEDRYYIEDQVSSGRSGLIVIMSDRGPHNAVVRVTSNARFFQQYGKPVIDRTGQAHYIASQFLRRSNQLYVIRAALLDSPIPTHNCALANVAIRYTPTEGGTEEILTGNFIFTAVGPVDLDGNGPLEPIYLGQWDQDNAYQVFGSEFISKYIFCNYAGYDGVNVDDFISVDGSYESIRVVGKGKIPLYDEVTKLGQGTNEGNTIYYLELDSYYTGRSTETDLGELPIKLKDDIKVQVAPLIAERDSTTTPATPERIAEINAIINPLVSNLNNYTYLLYDSNFINEKTRFKKASKFYFGPKEIKFTDSFGVEFYPTCAFTKGSNIVICGPGEDANHNTLDKSEQTFESIYQEEWIMSDNDFRSGVAANSETQPILRQIIEKLVETSETGGVDTFKFILDAPYTGESTPKDEDGTYVWDRMYTHTPVQTNSSKNVKSA